MVYIGIDLGTTYSRVSVIKDGQPFVIASDDDKRTISSVVTYCGSEILVGNSALNCNTDPTNILYDSKNLIGWKFIVDLPNPENRYLWTFNVDTRDGFCGYVLNKGKPNERFIKAEEVSAEILKKLKATAEGYLDKQITDAVVTIPAFFNLEQINATKRATQMAGLELEYLLHEPITAAIAYYNQMRITDSTIMVFDLGAGTLDISIVEIKKEKFDVKSVCGDAHLGGQDFDERIMKYVVDEMKKSDNFDISRQSKWMKRLRKACKEAKESLSFHMESYNIYLDINDDTSVNVEISRSNLNQLCEDLFDKAMEMVERALRTARILAEKIDNVILVGGSTRIPKIQELLSHKFGQAKLRFDANPEDTVAHGAAIIADALEKGIKIPLIELSWNITNSHKMLFYLYYENNDNREGRICLFNSYTRSVEEIAKFDNWYWPYEVATTQNKIFGIDNYKKSFEIYDLDTRQLSRGPDPPEWRQYASVAYFRDKLYYLGGYIPGSVRTTNRVDVLIDGKWQTGPALPFSIRSVRTITCDGILYVIDGRESRKIYRLSDDEREWIKVGKIPKQRISFGVASLNRKIYITGGYDYPNKIFKSCLCFDPSAPVDRRISRIPDMNYARHHHSLVAANGKLYAIGGFQKSGLRDFCNSIEEYVPQTNKWRKVEKINLHKILFYLYYRNNDKSEGRICLFNSYTCSVEEIAKLHNCYSSYEVATTQNKIFGIDNYKKLFEIYDLNIRQISRGPDPPEWRKWASVTYFKDKLYYLGGWDPDTSEDTNRVDVLIDGQWQTGPAFPLPIGCAQIITCDEILYVIDGRESRKIYRLSDDERGWIEIGELLELRYSFEVASLNGKIYITGGLDGRALKSCLCFNLSAPVGGRISRIADMNYARYNHSLLAANGKLYAIGGYQSSERRNEGLYCPINFCDAIEEYDPQTNKWQKVEKFNANKVRL